MPSIIEILPRVARCFFPPASGSPQGTARTDGIEDCRLAVLDRNGEVVVAPRLQPNAQERLLKAAI